IGKARRQEPDAVAQHARSRGDWHVSGAAKRCVGFEARHNPAAGPIEFGPPTVIVIAEVEYVAGAGLDRYFLGDDDVVDVGRAHHVVDWARKLRIIDDMSFGAAHFGGKTRPFRPDAGKMKAGRVNQADHFAHVAPELATGHAEHVFEQAGKHQRTASSIGIRKGGARRHPPADVIKSPLMARHRGFNGAKRIGPCQLTEQKRNELMSRLELANEFIRPVFLHKTIENRPRNQFQDVMQDAILMPHGVDPFRVQMIRNQLEASRINVVHSIKHEPYRTAVALCRASTSFRAASKTWIAGTRPGHDEREVQLESQAPSGELTKFDSRM